MSQEFWFGMVSLFIVIFGSIGNLLVIFSLYHQKKLLKKNNHYYLVLHLAICDLALLLFTTEYIYTSFTGLPFAFSTIFCKTWSTIHTLFFIMEAGVMVLISLIRYRAVLYPFRAPLKRWQINLALGAVWVFAIVCMIPFFLWLNFSSQGGCNMDWPGRTFSVAYTIFLASVEYVIPLLLLSLSYQRIYFKIRQQNKQAKQLIASQTSMKHFQKCKQDQNRSIFRVNCIIVFCFTLCAFPVQCLGIFAATGTDVPPIYYNAFYIFYLAGVCSLNPFIYKVFDKRVFGIFKQFMRQMIRHASFSRMYTRSTQLEPSFPEIEKNAP